MPKTGKKLANIKESWFLADISSESRDQKAKSLQNTTEKF